jgi:ketosteroid isomerase-like protein
MNDTTAMQALRDALDRANRANEALLHGDSGPLKACFSHRDDASVLGGFGGHEVGWALIGPRLDWVADSFIGGHFTYELIVATPGTDMGMVVQIERGQVQLKQRPAPQEMALRVTMVFHREDGEWKLLHRHADGLVEKRAAG